ncbi:MAG: hypothetical protein IPM42_18995 [Saprospiraceae bacterium]|nr:hypothetical protein [Saprospiraceae bacterium]
MNQEKMIEKMQEEQEYIKNIQNSLYENFNILLDNQKNRVENQDLVVQNQSLIIRNQDVIVNNQINIIRNQKQIVENQVTLAVILKTQSKLLHLMNQIAGNETNENDVNQVIQQIYIKTKEQFDNGTLKIYDMETNP